MPGHVRPLARILSHGRLPVLCRIRGVSAVVVLIVERRFQRGDGQPEKQRCQRGRDDPAHQDGYPFGGIGENTLVWYPASLDPASASTIFPFSGMDTVYSVAISNVITDVGFRNYNYTVTLF